MQLDDSKNQCMDFYNTIASIYDRAIISNETDWIIRKLENKLVKSIIRKNEVISNNLIIDVGAGTGYYSILASNYFDRVISIDISVEMMKRMDSKGENICRITSDSANLPFDNDKFDVALCLYGVLGYLNGNARVKTIKEINRVLKDNGKFIFSIWRYTKEHNFKNWTVNNSNKFLSVFEDKLTDEEFYELMSYADFDIIEYYTIPNLSGKLYRRLLNKNIYSHDKTSIKLLILYYIEKILVHVAPLNKNGWLFIGVAKKRINKGFCDG